MQLISTKRYDDAHSTEYLKSPLIIRRVGAVTDVTEQKEAIFVPVDIVDFIRQSESEKELSVFLKPLIDIDLLGRFYTFNNPIEVKRFLLAYDYLIGPLFEAYKHIKQIFGENIVDVCLECDKDPEEDFEGLSAIIKTNLSPELSLDLLDKFDKEWWLDVDDEIRIVLTIMVRPI